MSDTPKRAQSATNRAAWLATGFIFPLIWLGGLVTTHDAGMAVPDWPGTYGYNLFAYPISTWIYGPFDLFVEHGHRLLASLVGLLSIWLCFVAVRQRESLWIRQCCFLLLGLVIGQGILGGLRVLFDARVFAMIHGCLGPLLFALGGYIVMATSTDRRQATPSITSRGLARVAGSLFVLAIIQLFVGANLRHAMPYWAPAVFTSLVHTHLLMATLITFWILWIAVLVRTGSYRAVAGIRAPANELLLIVVLQVLLGLATWVANYATPWIEWTPWLARYTVQGKGFWESMIITGHQATGALLILCGLWFRCRIQWRMIRAENRAPHPDESHPKDNRVLEPARLAAEVS